MTKKNHDKVDVSPLRGGKRLFDAIYSQRKADVLQLKKELNEYVLQSALMSEALGELWLILDDVQDDFGANISDNRAWLVKEVYTTTSNAVEEILIGYKKHDVSSADFAILKLRRIGNFLGKWHKLCRSHTYPCPDSSVLVKKLFNELMNEGVSETRKTPELWEGLEFELARLDVMAKGYCMALSWH